MVHHIAESGLYHLARLGGCFRGFRHMPEGPGDRRKPEFLVLLEVLIDAGLAHGFDQTIAIARPDMHVVGMALELKLRVFFRNLLDDVFSDVMRRAAIGILLARLFADPRTDQE